MMATQGRLERLLREHLRATAARKISYDSFQSWFLSAFGDGYAAEGEELERMINETAEVMAIFSEGPHWIDDVWRLHQALGVIAGPMAPRPETKPKRGPKGKRAPVHVPVNTDEARIQARLDHLQMIRRLMIAPVPGAQHRGKGTHRVLATPPG